MRLLVIEDHQKINDLIALYARQDGHEVYQVYSAEDAFLAIAKKCFDLIITDLMLPGIQGEELIKIIRKTSDVYIITISAKTDINHKIDVITLGADDYLTKPFSVEELLAKLANLEKRIKADNRKLSFYEGELIIHLENRNILFKGNSIVMSTSAFDILSYLAKNPNRVYSRSDILELVLIESDAFDRVIDVHIKNIRKALDDAAKKPRYIKTHYGAGYQFIGEIDA